MQLCVIITPNVRRQYTTLRHWYLTSASLASENCSPNPVYEGRVSGWPEQSTIEPELRTHFPVGMGEEDRGELAWVAK
ncbi:hypothetical protein Pmani_034457 [Petrolisthes manimaculis]|uniref:Uncharacterized protein n=1 Tax=Petrolisthes manimaculis TaxID=1843537 RepID=A0AAE1NMI0_9EUCA|nr:hypothetical protein Pmani_034457 [Petrolisthes manimaculis]